MNKLIISIIIIILCIVYLLTFNEQFEASTCNFVPWGKTKNECKSKCNNTPSWLEKVGCTKVKCAEICENCKDIELCNWDNKEQIEEKQTQIPYNETIDLTIKDNIITWKWNGNSAEPPNLKFYKIYVVNYYNNLPHKFLYIYKINDQTDYKFDLTNIIYNNKYIITIYAIVDNKIYSSNSLTIPDIVIEENVTSPSA
jgi:hypothetical protein